MTSQDIKFRASGVGHLMVEMGLTEAQAKELAYLLGRPAPTDIQKARIGELIAKRDSDELPKGIRNHVIDVYTSVVDGRREVLDNKYIKKGNVREEDSITILSRFKKMLFTKNAERLFNDWVQGEPDIFVGDDIYRAEETYDTKSMWSLNTFRRAKFSPLDMMWEWQGHAYMDLTQAKAHHVALCLVNSPAELIIGEKRKMAFSMGVSMDSQDEAYLEVCAQLEKNHIFDMQHFMIENPGFDFAINPKDWHFDLPMEERVHIFSFKRDDAKIDDMHRRVDKCRVWMDKNLFKNQPAALAA